MSIHNASILNKVDPKSFDIRKEAENIILNNAAWKEISELFKGLVRHVSAMLLLQFFYPNEEKFMNYDCMFGLLSPHQKFSMMNCLFINLVQDKLSVQFPTDIVNERIYSLSEDKCDFYISMMVMRGLLKDCVYREVQFNKEKSTVKQEDSWIVHIQKVCFSEYKDGLKDGEVSYFFRNLIGRMFNTFFWKHNGVSIDKNKISKTLHKNCNYYDWCAMIDFVMGNILFKHVPPGLCIIERCSFDNKGEYHKHQAGWIKDRTEKFEKIYTPNLLPSVVLKLFPKLNDVAHFIAQKVHILPHPINFRYQKLICSKCGKKSQFKCSQCGVERYCSRACQKEHWNQHKTICNQFNK